jgi:Mg2+ and Co2+ transporter CorA
MEERIQKLEATSNSHATAIAAMENDMNDRFDRIEDELSELRQNKAGSASTLYRLTNLQDEMNRRFGEVKEDIQRRSVELRAHIDFTTSISREENERRFADMRRDFEVRFEMLQGAQERHFGYVDKRFEQVGKCSDPIDKRFERLVRVESSVADLRKELHIFMRWSLGIHATVLFGVAALLAKAYLA